MKPIKRLQGAVLLSSICLLSLTTIGSADVAIQSFTGGSVNNISSYVVGYDFTLQERVLIEKLGIIDANKNGVLDESTAPSVGIWNSDGALLGSAQIADDSIVENDTFFQPITPIALEPGSYTIGAVNYQDGERFLFQASSAVDPAVNVVRGRFTAGAQLKYPASVSEQNIYLGPNFEFSYAGVSRSAGGKTNNIDSYMVGYDFTVDTPITVNRLGVFDQNGNGILDESKSPTVGLWNSQDDLLGSIDVPLSASAVDGVFYADIEAIDLAPGVYTIAALNHNGGERFWFDAVIDPHSEIQIGAGRAVKSDVFTYPTGVMSKHVYLGPNFQFTRPGSMSVATPREFDLYQQHNNVASIDVSGTVEGATEVEARLVKREDSQRGYTTPWVQLDSQVADNGEFVGQLSAQAGWYDLEIKGVRDENTVSFATVEKIGIGEIFLMAGQSNSANFGKPAQVPSYDQILALGTDRFWQTAVDPQPNATGTNGSAWPAMGDRLYEKLGIPIGVVATGQGGTRVGQWHSSLYQSRLKPVIEDLGTDGFRAILWHQGESDSIANTSAENYQTLLNQVIAWSREDAGFQVPWGVALASFHPKSTESAEQAVIAGQQAVIDNTPSVFKGAETNDYGERGFLRDGVHFTAAGLQHHGQQWAELLDDQFDFNNISRDRLTKQSTTRNGAYSSRAVDGDQSGHFASKTITHTQFEANPWWQVDLGAANALSSVSIWNRTDCCEDRLKNFYVLVADFDMEGFGLAQLLTNDAVAKYHYPDVLSGTATIELDAYGRYLRIQKADAGYLSLAEVEVTAQ
ncbi:MAG: discoidin domain-containing protein [Gammaproteobacteria bacterium]|nr:discoidin domain-containing protein [Gammaproteobacteria bacterium]